MGKSESIENLIEIIRDFQRKEEARNPYLGARDGSEQAFFHSETAFFECDRAISAIKNRKKFSKYAATR